MKLAERQLRDRIARLGVEVAAVLLRQSVSDPMARRRCWPIGRCGCLKKCRREERARMAADLGQNSVLEVASAAALSSR